MNTMFARVAGVRVATTALRSPILSQARMSSTSTGAKQTSSFAKKAAIAAGATAVVGAGAYIAVPNVYASGAAEGLHPPHYPWDAKEWNKTFDKASVRRGFQVYKEVCSACHSLKRIAFRNLVGVTHTEEEAKALAAEYEVEDGPDDDGEMFMRPGKLADYFPSPYKNDEAARAANAGALPPDLSLIVLARHAGADYIFSLLTGYMDAPAGAEVKEGLNYNPYFPGTWIAMARNLYDGIVEFEDGTPATTSQMAKDVTMFLWWAAEPDMDRRKELAFKALVLMVPLAGLTWYIKRFKFASFKTRKMVFNPPPTIKK